MTADIATSLDKQVHQPFSPASELSSSITPPRTPTATATAAHQVFVEIESIYNALIDLPSLAPGLQINSLLTRLVTLCSLPYSPDLSQEILRLCASRNLCENLRPLCGTAEGCLESYWAQHIISETKKLTVSQDTISSSSTTSPRSIVSSTSSLLTTFPYHQNYADLTQLEVSSISPYLASAPRNMAFIGSGPLPLTSICLQSHYPAAHILNIDRDMNALRISQELCKSVGCGDRMRYASDDVSVMAEGGIDWKSFDVVFLAALVGMDSSSKASILASLASKLTPGTLVVARSARGVRSVLYPVLDLGEDLQSAGYQVLAEVHPWTDVVNSIVVLRVKAG